MNKRKPTTHNTTPTKIVIENCDILLPYITALYNESNLKSEFPTSLKRADINPTHKKDERSLKNNYRPVSVLPAISKIFERNMYDQISNYIEKYLSPYLCGFRKGYNTQHCLTVMLERWKKGLDNDKMPGALLTDLSKAFDCINHELLIAKLNAYGFSKKSLTHIYSYLSERKQRTKINGTFSSWADIIFGVPQGSIVGPLLFNINLNDIFYFITKGDMLTNFADDNTPYSIEESIDILLMNLWKNTSILSKWFEINFFRMNPDKCHLLVCNHTRDVSIILKNEIINSSNTVKLLGITIRPAASGK